MNADSNQVSVPRAVATGSSDPSAATKHCPRCDLDLPITEFGIFRARKDGLSLYCKRCINQKIAAGRARRAEYLRARGVKRTRKPVAKGAPRPSELAKLPPTRRVLLVLDRLGPLQFKDLRHATRLTTDQLSDALPHVIGFQLPVGSRNGSGPRMYFLKREIQKPDRKEGCKEPPLSFSTLDSQFTTPMVRGSRR